MSKTTRLDNQDVMKTFRVLLATCIQQYGKMGTLVLTRAQMEAASQGSLRVSDRPDGSVVLEIRQARGLIRPH